MPLCWLSRTDGACKGPSCNPCYTPRPLSAIAFCLPWQSNGISRETRSLALSTGRLLRTLAFWPGSPSLRQAVLSHLAHHLVRLLSQVAPSWKLRQTLNHPPALAPQVEMNPSSFTSRRALHALGQGLSVSPLQHRKDNTYLQNGEAGEGMNARMNERRPLLSSPRLPRAPPVSSRQAWLRGGRGH